MREEEKKRPYTMPEESEGPDAGAQSEPQQPPPPPPGEGQEPGGGETPDPRSK
jgi:hypothetical protein